MLCRSLCLLVVCAGGDSIVCSLRKSFKPFSCIIRSRGFSPSMTLPASVGVVRGKQVIDCSASLFRECNLLRINFVVSSWPHVIHAYVSLGIMIPW